MELLQRMAADMLRRGEVTITLSPDTVQHLENRCFEVLEWIRQIIADDGLDDPECFQRIEQIVCELERRGIDCGTRHDFG